MAGKKRSREQAASYSNGKSTANAVAKSSRNPTQTMNPSRGKGEMEDWALNLAKASTGSASSSIPSKKERMERRAAKQARRSAKLAKSSKGQEEYELRQGTETRQFRTEDNILKRNSHESSSKRRLQDLSSILRSIHKAGIDSDTSKSKRSRIPYTFGSCSVKKMKKAWEERSIQPRKSDYGGIGLARPSLYIGFDDLSFFPKLRLEFQEHVPGFFGVQRTKSMKRQLDGDMLWRQLAQKKKQDVSINGKKLSKMSPDDRVMALIESGAL